MSVHAEPENLPESVPEADPEHALMLADLRDAIGVGRAERDRFFWKLLSSAGATVVSALFILIRPEVSSFVLTAGFLLLTAILLRSYQRHVTRISKLQRELAAHLGEPDADPGLDAQQGSDPDVISDPDSACDPDAGADPDSGTDPGSGADPGSDPPSGPGKGPVVASEPPGG